jgi:murein DD-endopeptidase MepM/ murein hydrolase activator NlpD
MFARPVDRQFPVRRYFGDTGSEYSWSMDPDTGYWVPIQYHGKGQHTGTDFSCVKGTVVRAMSDGMVIKVGHENRLDHKVGAGLHIVQLVNLMGYDSWLLKYSHLKAAYVSTGQMVSKYDPIAESGDSGAVSEPYLHVDMMDLKHQYKAIQFELE